MCPLQNLILVANRMIQHNTRQWRIQGGDLGVRTPPSASTSLIIHYSQSTYDSLHDTAQLAPAPSENTITAASSCYALEVDRTSEQSAGLRAIRTVRVKKPISFNTIPCGFTKSHRNETETARTILRKRRLPFRSVSFRSVSFQYR